MQLCALRLSECVFKFGGICRFLEIQLLGFPLRSNQLKRSYLKNGFLDRSKILTVYRSNTVLSENVATFGGTREIREIHLGVPIASGDASDSFSCETGLSIVLKF